MKRRRPRHPVAPLKSPVPIKARTLHTWILLDRRLVTRNRSGYGPASSVACMTQSNIAALLSTVETLARHAGVPVYNALTDEYHPTQMIADVMTMREHADKPHRGHQVCLMWGDTPVEHGAFPVDCGLSFGNGRADMWASITLALGGISPALPRTSKERSGARLTVNR